jgi:hypothetical protein
VGRLKKLTGQARMIKQAYTLTRKNDPKLPWVMLIWFVAVAAVVELVGILLSSPFIFLPLALISGGLAALIVTGGSPPASPAPSRWTPSTGCSGVRA